MKKRKARVTRTKLRARKARKKMKASKVCKNTHPNGREKMKKLAGIVKKSIQDIRFRYEIENLRAVSIENCSSIVTTLYCFFTKIII